MNSISAHQNGKIYDMFYANRTLDIDFYTQQAIEKGGPILEIGCGTGRITIPVFEKGMDITGLDLSPAMLKQARIKNPDIEWVEASATNFDLGRQFQTIFMPFRILQLLVTLHDMTAALENVKKHLRDGGYLILDVFHPNLSRLTKDASPRKPACTAFNHPEIDEIIDIEYTQSYDYVQQATHVTFYYSRPDRKILYEDTLQMRCYFPQEIDYILQSFGFDITHKFGDFAESQFNADSTEQIFICRKT